MGTSDPITSIILEWAPRFSLLGLVFDFFGALILLGPELPVIAKVLTYLDRWRVKRLISRLEEGDLIKEGDLGFEDLKILFQELRDTGIPSEKPHEQREWPEDSLLRQVDGIEGVDGFAVFRSSGKDFTRVNIDRLKARAEVYTGEDRIYFKVGGFLLASGFFFQFVSELAPIYPTLSLVLLFVGISVIIYIAITRIA